MNPSKVLQVVFLAQLGLQASLSGLAPQSVEQDLATPGLEFQLFAEGKSFEARISYPGEEFFAAVFISDRGSSTLFNAQGDRFMDGAFLVVLGVSEGSIYRADLPMQELLEIGTDWYLQAILLSDSGRLVFGDIEYWPDLVSELPPPADDPRLDIDFFLLVTEGIPPQYQLYAEYEAYSDDYELIVDSVVRVADRSDVYFILVTPGVNGGMHDVVEMHRTYAELGADPGATIRALVGTRTQDVGNEDLRYRVLEEFSVF